MVAPSHAAIPSTTATIVAGTRVGAAGLTVAVSVCIFRDHGRMHRRRRVTSITQTLTGLLLLMLLLQQLLLLRGGVQPSCPCAGISCLL